MADRLLEELRDIFRYQHHDDDGLKLPTQHKSRQCPCCGRSLEPDLAQIKGLVEFDY